MPKVSVFTSIPPKAEELAMEQDRLASAKTANSPKPKYKSNS